MKMEQTEFSETSAYKIQTPENYPEKSIQEFYFYLDDLGKPTVTSTIHVFIKGNCK